MTTTTTAHLTTPDGTRIAYRDHTPPAGPERRPPVLLLHGLAGHMAEWDALIPRLLADGHRVVAYDARGHGESTRVPDDMTRAAAVRDAVTLIDALSLRGVILVGQSLGGLTALLTAAAHPSRVEALIVVEAGPAGRNPNLPADMASWLDSWPAPFKTLADATIFFGHEAWARGLDWRVDGGWARVDRATMLAAVAELATDDYWAQWSRITRPTLVIRGENGTMPEREAAQMRARRPSTQVTVVANAAHDVHLDQPDVLYEAIAGFVSGEEDGTVNEDEPPEHARFATYVRELRQVTAAEEVALIRGILTDPDQVMARSAVLRHLDERATALHLAPAYAPWAESMTQATADHPFLTTRLREWTLLRSLALAHPWAPQSLTQASDWLQRKVAETSSQPEALSLLAEQGRTKRVRHTARTRLLDLNRSRG
ncbi:alpha/beta fold hydrolase [Streptomyces sp. NPDC002888]|uniref:alpha/beta fold hydrolase n=1 Tax=Streptomyces sp. NPDC002888 TaxID=3364668 RepID=UPI00369B9F75